MDIGATVPGLLTKHPAVTGVTLTGSRARDKASRWSDWDFLVETTDFAAVSAALPALTEKLAPLSYIWDPLSRHHVFMLILRGPVKIDLIFNFLHPPESPWDSRYPRASPWHFITQASLDLNPVTSLKPTVCAIIQHSGTTIHPRVNPWNSALRVIRRDTLAGVNSHFWDWILWIGSKKVRGNPDIVKKELDKMYIHLLKPLGCDKVPDSVEEAVSDFTAAFQRKMRLLHTRVNPALRTEVVRGLQEMGFQI
jgi:hypothetical protein